MLYCALTLFGIFLITRDVDKSGCDPSGGVAGNTTCGHNGTDVLGAMLGLTFAAQGISQVGSFFQTFTAARSAVFPAIQTIHRKNGTPGDIIYEPAKNVRDDSETEVSAGMDNLESGNEKRIKAILPNYIIDPTSDDGVRPAKVEGALAFKDVDFAYPTQPNQFVLKNFSLEIPAGKTVALVGVRYV